MRRRDFITALAGAAMASCRARVDWRSLRLMHRRDAAELVRTALSDALSLLETAIGSKLDLVDDSATPGELDVLVTTSRRLPRALQRPGAFQVRTGSTPRVLVAGFDAEGARNGLYAFMEHLGFRFFRDTDAIPELRDEASLDIELASAPAFRWRGDMIWDNYLGPRRFCASVWSEEDWERALVFLARNRMNFLEFYPPLEYVLANVFPEAEGLDDGSVWKSKVKHELAKKVLTRARALGIHCMYVLSYGAFPQPVRALFPHLEWRNGFLCAHQPELMELAAKTWRALIDELGTDHWYAIRHRGEEEQVYSDPCRSITKSRGFLQAFSVMRDVDPKARMTAWTWGEKIPQLFDDFPSEVRAVHIRHGMADVFGDRGEGREQKDGRPDLPRGRKWLSGQFTVFGGNETLLQTGWSDAAALQKDAAASARDDDCEGYFQWPEWSDTSPWLSHVIARLAWDPRAEPSLAEYARARHGELAAPFLSGFRPLLRRGNARFMHPPRKRLLVPFYLTPESLEFLREVRVGASEMSAYLDRGLPAFERDFLDLATWLASRQAQTLEVDAYLRQGASFEAARATWKALHALLSQVPELSIVGAARSVRQVGELSGRAEESFWTLACDFYRGYPLVMSPEAIELVYLPQLDALSRATSEAEEPGWFWHDFPDRSWADTVRKLPNEHAEAFERVMRKRIRDALAGAEAPHRSIDFEPFRQILAIDLPEARDEVSC